MADNQFSSFFGAFQGIAGAMMSAQGYYAQSDSIIQGGEVAAQGYQLQAAGYRQSKVLAQYALDFNLQIDNINNFRKMESMGRQYERAAGQQVSQIAASGVSINSKSSLMLHNEMTDYFTRNIMNAKIDAENQRRSRIFDTQVKQVNLENAARAADYSAAAERVLAANKAAQADAAGDATMMQGIMKGIGGIFGGFS